MAAMHKTPKLTEGCDVTYRNSSNVRQCSANVKHIPAARDKTCLQVMIRDQEVQRQDDIIINLKDIRGQRARDYFEGSNLTFTLLVSALRRWEPDEELPGPHDEDPREQQDQDQHAFTFETQQERDYWDEQLGTLRRSLIMEERIAGGSASFRRVVKAVNINEAATSTSTAAGGQKNAVAVSLKLELAPIANEDSVVPAGIQDESPERTLEILNGEDMKQQVKDFCKRADVNLLPTEGTSLYRLCKAILSRQKALKEVQKLVGDIEQSYYGLLVEGGQPVSANALQKANDDLAKIGKDLPTRIGSSGVGAQFVCKVLERNIEKLKMINEILDKKHSNRGTPRPGLSPRV